MRGERVLMYSDWTLTKLLNRVSKFSTTKTHTYNKMACINSKPVLQKGNENLLEYKLSLPLHINFCNPKKMIELIEKKANEDEPIEWIYNGEYMGTFVIDEVSKSIENQIKGVIIYAVVNLNLLEVPQSKEYEAQKKEDVDLSEYEQYDETSDIMQNFSTEVKQSIKENMKNAVLTGIYSGNLTDASKELFNNVALSVANDIGQGAIVDMYANVKKYTDAITNNSPLSIQDTKNLAYQISNIPNLVLNSALRKG